MIYYVYFDDGYNVACDPDDVYTILICNGVGSDEADEAADFCRAVTDDDYYCGCRFHVEAITDDEL